MILSESELLVRVADHVAKLSDIVAKQSKTILESMIWKTDSNRLKKQQKNNVQ
jgi:hypothetical protein